MFEDQSLNECLGNFFFKCLNMFDKIQQQFYVFLKSYLKPLNQYIIILWVN